MFLSLAACTAPQPPALGVRAQAGCDGTHRVACENQQPGTPTWQLTNAVLDNAHTLEGYASNTSVNKGELIHLFISSDQGPQPGQLQVYRMGWYPNPGPLPAGARLVYGPLPFTAANQPIPAPQGNIEQLVQCQWTETIALDTSKFSSPDGLGPVSGYYLVKLSLTNLAAQRYIIFVLRDDIDSAPFLMNAAVTTYQAYNCWGQPGFERSFYECQGPGSTVATQVSFDRPYGYNQGAGNFLDPHPDQYSTATGFPETGWEYLMVRFLEREGYDVTYATDIDLHSPPSGGLFTRRAAFLSVGHDEYWSKPMHDNLRAARESGKHVGFFSGNSVFWIIEVLQSLVPPPQTPQDNRRLQTFKSDSTWLWQNCAVTPTNAPRCNDTGEQSEQTLVGSITTDGYEDRGDIQFNFQDLQAQPVPPPQWVLDMLNGSQLHDGSRIPGLIGYEGQTICGQDTQSYTYSDCYYSGKLAQRRPVPDNQTRLTHSKFKARLKNQIPEYLWSDISVYQSKTSGAWVFSTGSPDWNLALDVYNNNSYRVAAAYNRVHPAIPQMTRYVLKQFGDTRTVTPLTAEAYTVTVSRNQNGTYHLVWTNPAGRPPSDFIQVYDINSNDDNPLTYDMPCAASLGACDRTVPTGVTATADYVTLDLSWYSNWHESLRTIWRAAKSARFTVQ